MEQPEQRRLTNEDPLTGALKSLGAIASGSLGRIDREDALTDKFNRITVDTCLTSDTGFWETGILREEGEDKWIIVSQYRSGEEAEEEHDKWVAYMKETPDCNLSDIDYYDIRKLIKGGD